MLIKYTFLILLLLSFLKKEYSLAQIYCPSEETFLGPVVSLKETTYELPERSVVLLSNPDTSANSLQLLYESNYKVEHGLITEKQMLSASGFQKCRCTSKYSKDGHLLEKMTFGPADRVDTKIIHTRTGNKLVRTNLYNGDHRNYSTRVYIHDSIQRTQVSKEVFDDHEENILLTQFNSDHQPLKQFYVDDKGIQELFAEFQYDSLGRVIVTHVWNADSKYDQHYTSNYDSQNRLIKREWFDRDRVFMGVDSIVYDSHSKIVFEHFYDFISGTWSDISYTYQLDAFGNFLMKETWLISPNGTYLKSRISREYRYEE